MENKLQAALISSWSEFKTLSNEWNALLRESNADSIFLTWEWLTSCIESVDWNLVPRIIIVRDNENNLVGVAPFYVSRYRFLGFVPIRVLRLIPDVVKGSEYLDFIAAKRCEGAVYQCIFDALEKSYVRWDCMWIPRVSGWSGAIERFRKALSRCSRSFKIRSNSFSSMKLPESFETYLSELTSKSRAQIRRELRKVLATESTEICNCETQEELPRFLEALFYLHNRRWEAVGQPGAFSSSIVETRFHRIFAPKALKNDWLRISALRDNHEFKAVQIGYVYKNTFNSLQEGFDPTYTAGCGNALRSKVIERLIDERIREYDFLGGHSRHKRRWSAIERFGADFLLGGNSLIGRLLVKAGVWPNGRYLNLQEP